MSDPFGHYYYSNNDLIFIESGSDTPAYGVIVEFGKNEITFADGTVISKDSEHELYTKLKELAKPATIESDATVTSYGNNYSIQGVLLSTD